MLNYLSKKVPILFMSVAALRNVKKVEQNDVSNDPYELHRTANPISQTAFLSPNPNAHLCHKKRNPTTGHNPSPVL